MRIHSALPLLLAVVSACVVAPDAGDSNAVALTAQPVTGLAIGNVSIPTFSTATPTFDIPAATPFTAMTSKFVAAIAVANATVHIAAGAQIDLSGLERIPVASGVQIVGGTDSVLFTTTFPTALLVLNDNVRVTGIRVEGAMSDDPFSAVGTPDSDGLRVESSQNVEIDHCEIDHWRGAAVQVKDDDGRIDLAHADTVWVHDNYIHNNQHPTADAILPDSGHGAGYGVELANGAYAFIERNVFNRNRHAITGDGSPESGYYAYRNLILPWGGINRRQDGFVMYTHAIDMHGSSSSCGLLTADHECGPAGEFMDIKFNTVWYTSGGSVKLRGTPSRQMRVTENVFAGDPAAVEQTETGLQAFNNAFDVNRSGDVARCDFDGDGAVDAMVPTGAGWWYMSSARHSQWVFIDASTRTLSQLTYGDVNGDGFCDVTADGVTRYGSDGGTFTVTPTNGTAVAVARTSDGRLELFGGQNSSLHRAQAHPGDVGWPEWSRSDGVLTAVAAEANKDGRLEVFGVNGAGQIWHHKEITAGSDIWSSWEQIDGFLVSIAVARNADGRLEVFGTNSAGTVWHRWQVSPGGPLSAWQALDGSMRAIAAELNADGRIELIAVNSSDQIFRRLQTTANLNAWTPWSQIDGLLTQVALARNADGRLELFGTNGAGMTFHRGQVVPGGGYGAWSRFDGENLRAGSMAAEINLDGRLEVFGVDRLGQVVHRWQNTPTRWSSWSRLRGALNGHTPGQ